MKAPQANTQAVARRARIARLVLLALLLIFVARNWDTLLMPVFLLSPFLILVGVVLSAVWIYERRSGRLSPGWRALVWACAINLAVVAPMVVGLARMPAGAEVSREGLLSYLLAMEILSLFTALSFAAEELVRKGRHVSLGLVAAALALAPVPLGLAVFYAIAAVRHLHLRA
jgi:hypothetical protein